MFSIYMYMYIQHFFVWNRYASGEKKRSQHHTVMMQSWFLVPPSHPYYMLSPAMRPEFGVAGGS